MRYAKRTGAFISTATSILPGTLGAVTLIILSAGSANAEDCSSAILASVRSPATKDAASIELRCDLMLDPGDMITKRILLSGENASGARIDCRGATLDGTRGSINFGKPTILIRSVPDRKGGWSVPKGVQVRNCVIKGAIRLQGLGTNGQAEPVRTSSLTSGHTAHAQASAPSGVRLSGMTFIADGRIPLYLGPGVTGLSLTGSIFKGKSNGTALYLDAESAGNTFIGNTFAVTTKSREQIAIDGSAHNVISDNTFRIPVNGGIFVYRNCGEGGTIRHQKPQYNTISGNSFLYAGSDGAKPAVWLNSRNGWQWHCFRDPAYPFGSSLSALDFAEFNTVTGNRLFDGHAALIRNSDQTNTVADNTVAARTP